MGSEALYVGRGVHVMEKGVGTPGTLANVSCKGMCNQPCIMVRYQSCRVPCSYSADGGQDAARFLSVAVVLQQSKGCNAMHIQQRHLRPHLSICHMPTRVPTELTAAGSMATSRAVLLSLKPASSKIAGV